MLASHAVSPIALQHLAFVMAARDVQPGRHLAPLERGASSRILVAVPMPMTMAVTVPMTVSMTMAMAVTVPMTMTMTGL